MLYRFRSFEFPEVVPRMAISGFLFLHGVLRSLSVGIERKVSMILIRFADILLLSRPVFSFE